MSRNVFLPTKPEFTSFATFHGSIRSTCWISLTHLSAPRARPGTSTVKYFVGIKITFVGHYDQQIWLFVNFRENEFPGFFYALKIYEIATQFSEGLNNMNVHIYNFILRSELFSIMQPFRVFVGVLQIFATEGLFHLTVSQLSIPYSCNIICSTCSLNHAISLLPWILMSFISS